MKKPAILLLFFVAITAMSYQFLFKTKAKPAVMTVNNTFEEDDDKPRQSGAARQLNSWFQAKGYPNPEFLSNKYHDAWMEYQESLKRNNTLMSRGSAANWTSMGVSMNGGSRIGGRVVTMAIDPSNNSNLWAGTASGGMYRCINANAATPLWTPVTTGLDVMGVSAILVHPTNSSIVYAGTGEVYNTEVIVSGFNVWKTRGTYGIGIVRTTNNGASWQLVMTKTSADMFAINSMAFHPTNPNTIYACATDGVYRTTNANAATPTWTQIATGKINVRDIAIHPTTPDVAVISVGNMTSANKGIFRTSNVNAATPTWTKITSGLPASFDGWITLDHSGAGRLIASIGRSTSTANNEVYNSTDFGLTWTPLNNSNHCRWQFWFAHVAAVNPFATDSIMFGGINAYSYRISSQTRSAAFGTIHDDQHDIKFDPIRRGRVYICNDGGIYRSTNGGVGWSSFNNGLNATQFYASLGVSRQDANVMIGGLQDNGQVLYNGTSWNSIGWGGGDGTACAIHPTNDNIMLAGRDAKQLFRSTNGGSSGGSVTQYWGYVGDSRTGFVPPVAFSLSSPSTAYMASDNIHISTNSGASFTNDNLGSGDPALTPGGYIEQRHKTAIALAVSPTNSNKLYVSTSPFAQHDNDRNDVYVTGQPNLLKTTTPATTPYTSIKGTLPDRFVMDIAISKFNDDSVYVALGGFGSSHVYLSPNGGTTWIDRSAGLPNVPFNAILIDPINPRVIYAGCDFGVWVSGDRGANWIPYNNGFWDATQIMDLQVDANNKLIAATHGKGVFRSDLYVHSTLPVTLNEFTGKVMPQHNELKWIVEDEENLSRYELERSSTGNSFTKITTIGSRNQTTQSTYSYNDITPPFEGYYRLKIIDLDGTYTYSSVVFLRRESGKTIFTVLGNPIGDVITVKYQIPQNQKLSMKLFNAAGAVIRNEEHAATAGIGMYTIYGFENLVPGVYLLRIQAGKEQQTIKLLKN